MPNLTIAVTSAHRPPGPGTQPSQPEVERTRPPLGGERRSTATASAQPSSRPSLPLLSRGTSPVRHARGVVAAPVGGSRLTHARRRPHRLTTQSWTRVSRSGPLTDRRQPAERISAAVPLVYRHGDDRQTFPRERRPGLSLTAFSRSTSWSIASATSYRAERGSTGFGWISACAHSAVRTLAAVPTCLPRASRSSRNPGHRRVDAVAAVDTGAPRRDGEVG